MISQRNIFLTHLAQTSTEPILIEPIYAKGVYIYDIKNKKYLDLISGIGVSSVGHRHPKVVKAIKDQLDKYMHVMVYGEFIQSPQTQFANSLCALLPSQLDNVFLVGSGSEAIEGAMKLAKKHTGRIEFLSMEDCYHGNTQAVMGLLNDEERKEGYGPYCQEVDYLRFDEESDFSKITNKTAAVIVETLMGEAGCKVHSKKYLQKLRKTCTQNGALLILDEVQCGVGRTGTMFAFEQYDIVPDILVLAKGIGGGMPIGAFVSSKEIMECFVENPVLGHITTFGGHPVCSAAAHSTLELLKEEDLIGKVKSKGELFRSLLKHPKVLDISGMGLMMAVKLKNHEEVKQVMAYCMENGIIIDWFLSSPESLRIAPPLIIDEETITFACETLNKAFDTLS